MARTTVDAPWQELEKQAYHAYREWHLWLALRERELAGRFSAGRANKHAPGTADAGQRTVRDSNAQKGSP